MVGVAFLDLNYNGLYDEGEPGYEGVTLEVIKYSDGESVGKGKSQKDGSFRVENLRSSTYKLRAILPEDGSIFTTALEGSIDQVNLFEQRSGRRAIIKSVIPLRLYTALISPVTPLCKKVESPITATFLLAPSVAFLNPCAIPTDAPMHTQVSTAESGGTAPSV